MRFLSIMLYAAPIALAAVHGASWDDDMAVSGPLMARDAQNQENGQQANKVQNRGKRRHICRDVCSIKEIKATYKTQVGRGKCKNLCKTSMKLMDDVFAKKYLTTKDLQTQAASLGFVGKVYNLDTATTPQGGHK